VTPDALAPLFILAAALLVAAGVVKLVRPRPTAQAMADADLPASDGLARVVGGAEVVVGLWALTTGGVVASLALATIYLVFAGFLAFVLRAHPDAGSCGCAGAKAVPPSLLHLVLNLVATGVGVAYAVVDGPGIGTWIGDVGIAAVVAIAGLGVAAWLLVVLVTEVPEAWGAWRPPAVEHAHQTGDRHASADEALALAGIGRGHASLWPDEEPPAEGDR
jgi:hypothetical protein